MNIRININVKVGRIVKFFVISDLFFLAGWGFIEPVFSVFIVQKVVGATLLTVGIAAAIYWILKSVLEIPIANFLDATPGERDDFMVLIGGLFLAAITAFAFTWVRTVWELYTVQVLHAIAFACYLPAWTAIFSRHLDKDRFSFDWSLDGTASGLAAGAAGLLSGILAQNLGYTAVFVAAGTLSLVAALVLVATPNLILPKPTASAAAVIKERTPASGGI